MATRPCSSAELRKKGNDYFKKAQSAGLAPVLRQTNLEGALRLYRQALFESRNNKDSVPCHKNITVASWKLAILHIESAPDIAKVHYYIQTSLPAYIEASRAGELVMSEEWMTGLDTSLYGHVEELGLILENEPEDELRGRILGTLCKALNGVSKKGGGSMARALAHFFKAESLFKCAQKLSGEVLNADSRSGEMACLTLSLSEEFLRCQSLLDRCLESLKIATSTPSRLGNMGDKLDDLEKRVELFSDLCTSRRALVSGNALVDEGRKAGTGAEELIWMAVDKYKEASMVVKERDLVAEAVAHSRLGKAFDEALKVTALARKYHYAAVQAALSTAEVRPRVIATQWYKESNDAIARFQEEVQKEEREREEEERAPILELLKDDLVAVKRQADRSAESFLKFLYKEFPPKNPEHKLGEVTNQTETKKALQKAILHYHPDKNTKEKFDMKWHVFCGEVVKCLNVKYDNYK